MLEIEHVAQSEERNYSTSEAVLGDTLSLVQEMVDLYQLVVSLIEKSGVPPKDEIVAGAQFLAACRYQLVVGALALLRGHVNDSFHFSRKAIELCAFAARVKKHPHMAMIWLQAWRSPDAYNAFREKFSPGKLFPQDHAILGKLYDRYDFASKFIHSSVYSTARHIQVVHETPSSFHLDFDYFQLKETDRSEPAGTFLWIIDTHFGILRVFEGVLDAVINSNRQRWDVSRNYVDSKIGMHKAKWQPILLEAEQSGEAGL
jgi:hypothetical protein